MTKVRFFNPGLGYSKIKEEVLPALDNTLSKGDLILRQDVEDFEATFAKYVGTKYCVALNSGTDALYLSLWALGIGPGDEVITCDHTFVASAQVIAQLGATPVLVPVGDDLLIRTDLIRAAITPKTKAIIPVHLTGAMANMTDVLALAQEFHLHVVEDAAQALGATQEVRGHIGGTFEDIEADLEVGITRKAGAFGDTGCFSFYPAKILGCYGDGGAVVTNNKNLADEIRELRNHYKKDYSKWGINSRFDNIQAVILNIKMKYLDAALARRREIAEAYRSLEGVTLPEYTEGRVWQDYVIRVQDRDALFDYLKEKGIETMKNEYGFPIPKGEIAKLIESETLRIPCNELMTDAEVEYVIETINGYYKR